MTPTLDAEAASLSPGHTASRTERFGRRMVGAGLALGLLAEWAFDGHALGLSVPLFALACLAALRWVGGREGWQAGKSVRWLLACGLFFAVFVAIRDSPTLAALNSLALGWCALAAVATWSGDSAVQAWSLAALFGRPLATGARTIPAGVRAASATVQLGGVKRVAGEWAWPLIRSAFLVTPVLFLLSGLLMSADAAFSKRMSGALDAVTGVSFATRLGALLWVTLVALVSAGALSLALARRRSQAVVVTANTGLQLGATEAFSLLGSVTALLLFFDAISIECALATDRCALPDGMTYAQYVHHGFAELMIAAGLVLVMLLALARRVSLKTPLAERSMQVLSSTLVVATLPLVLSGVGRLQLYESVYGFTVARVLAQAATVLVGVLLVLRGATLWVARERFTFGVVLAGFATLSALNLLDVEGFVTKQNLEVAQQTGELDEYYLGQLSADSVVVRQPFFDTHPGSRVPVFPAGVRTCTDRSLQAWTLACQRVYWQF